MSSSTLAEFRPRTVRGKRWKYRIEDFPEPYRTLYRILQKQGYIIIGRHSVYKKCHWTHAALVEERFCYKCRFYGIESHRCIQMSPSALWCWNACMHCWRLRPTDTMRWDDTKIPWVDDPDLIVEGSIEAHREALMGYRGHPRMDERMKKRLEEAMNPAHVAISLTGEPTLYPRLGELIKEYHKRGLTTFLVTRGIRPDVLANLEEEPTQLYVSLEAWDKKSFNYFNKPLVPRGWELTLKTLELLPSFSSMTVIRFTLVKSFNMHDEALKAWAKLVEISQPTYIEFKSYMHVGAARQRLSASDMAKHLEVFMFAKKFADMTGYRIVSQQIESRVVLLSRLDKPVRVGKGCKEGWEREKVRVEQLLELLERKKDIDETEYRMVLEQKI
ncbi:4-demethylwyosine synthase TYW1 [Hyperthermus butylicus]|uniref:S-adenosyl-L-methionine-dependent tRNA 4-demethylwyosine synthase n=1 Tax=Hyperthermus butylicus (strain DSM 5456 / JCM 9403 / PLM1-5) TaxID=415426 RepID=A2BLU6_HYPBU|nr:4-demethylwyosine synthase TYW1 [Hyperthermus butylicus]ABM80957.1 conserved archaeal protein [Hyperthermus butylicus DSM 5456]